MLTSCAKASVTEELHAGDCAGVPGNRHSYRGALDRITDYKIVFQISQ